MIPEYDLFPPQPVHTSHTNVSCVVLFTPNPSSHTYMLLDIIQPPFLMLVSVCIDEARGRKHKLLKISHSK